jgi:hypothetical protein
MESHQARSTKAMFCLSMMILATKILSMFVNVCFWIAFLAFLKTLFSWTQGEEVMRSTISHFNGTANASAIVNSTFPALERYMSYQLIIQVTGSGADEAEKLVDIKRPILLRNPVAWIFVLLLLLLIHPLARFCHDCLVHASNSTETLASQADLTVQTKDH